MRRMMPQAAALKGIATHCRAIDHAGAKAAARGLGTTRQGAPEQMENGHEISCLQRRPGGIAGQRPQLGGFDNFLKIDGIDGESTDASHRKWIDIDSWSWSLTNASSNPGSGGGVGKPVFSDFSWSQQVDASVVPLLLGVANGKHFSDATLDVTHPGGKGNNSFFQMVFSDVTLSELHTSANPSYLRADGALSYTALTLRYRPQDPNGGYLPWIEGSFSLKGNKVQFSGDPLVIQGLFTSGGNVSLVSGVPEPAAWALMTAGLALLGAATRRRRG